jgi:hypothetical protein
MKRTNPKTGDNSKPVLFFGTGLASIAAMIHLYLESIREKKSIWYKRRMEK